MNFRTLFYISKTFSTNSELSKQRRRLMMRKRDRMQQRLKRKLKSRRNLRRKWQKWISTITSQNTDKILNCSIKCTWTTSINWIQLIPTLIIQSQTLLLLNIAVVPDQFHSKAHKWLRKIGMASKKKTIMLNLKSTSFLKRASSNLWSTFQRVNSMSSKHTW